MHSESVKTRNEFVKSWISVETPVNRKEKKIRERGKSTRVKKMETKKNKERKRESNNEINE